MRPCIPCALAALALACSGAPNPVPTGGNIPIVADEPDAGPPTPAPAETNQACRAHGECPSGVCSHFKKDNGYCAEEACSPGERADNNNFYCDDGSRWIRSKREGDACAKSYECYAATCFMNPNCDLNPPDRARCRDGKCVSEPVTSPCERDGGQLVLACHEFWDGCVQSMAQHVLQTVCVPCGNGTCDEGECPCNCPEDCPK